MNIKKTDKDVLERITNTVYSPRMSEARAELEKLTRAVIINQEEREINHQVLLELMTKMNVNNPQVREWGDQVKRCVDHFVLLARQRQHLNAQLEDLRARLGRVG